MNVTYKTFPIDRKYGVEIEVNKKIQQNQLADLLKEVVDNNIYSTAWGYTSNNKEWQVKTDSSCGDTGKKSDGGGLEVISPAKRGIKHLLQIEEVTEKLKDIGAVTNKYCGFHCHVEIRDFSVEQTATLLAYWCKMEHYFLNAVPIHRLANGYCRPFTTTTAWEKAINADLGNTYEVFWDIMRLRKFSRENKRNAITLVNYFRSHSNSYEWESFNRCTVELRLPESSLDPLNIKNWTRLFVNFVHNVKNLPFPKNLNTANLQECLYYLGLSSEEDNKFSVLSSGLFETKLWFLYRILAYSTILKIRTEATEELFQSTTDRLKLPYTFCWPLTTENVEMAAT